MSWNDINHEEGRDYSGWEKDKLQKEYEKTTKEIVELHTKHGLTESWKVSRKLDVLCAMKFKMSQALDEMFKCWNCDKTHPIENKKDWGHNHVCQPCELYLFDEAEKREKRRDYNDEEED